MKLDDWMKGYITGFVVMFITHVLIKMFIL